MNRIMRTFICRTVQSNRTFASDASTISSNRERSMNIIKLIGRVGQDPKIANGVKDSEDGVSIQVSNKDNEKRRAIIFSVATQEYRGVNENNQPKFHTDWHRVCVFHPRIQENVEKYLRSGDRVYVQGRIRNDIIRDDYGDERYSTSIIADDVIFLSKVA